MKDRARLVAIERAVRKGFIAALERETTIDEAIRRTALRVLTELAGGDDASAVAAMVELDRQGKGRVAAMIVAKRIATDPSDPLEVETIAHRLRRLRRKADTCPNRGRIR